jgi:alkanesulfonate monooxygenase SsuD/methylene tetrahydromethanopterin reductase-like flavin-dependent oxidoreductase (luciferase family)
MKLGLFLAGPGQHIAAWRDPATDANAGQSLSHFVSLTQLAERAKFDFVFNADTQSTFGPDDINVWKRNMVAHRIEPITLLGALAAVTEHIGLVATATTTYLEPFHVARMFATLDQLSGGRSGWNLVTSSAATEALNFSHASHAAHDDRYERAAEFVQVMLGRSRQAAHAQPQGQAFPGARALDAAPFAAGPPGHRPCRPVRSRAHARGAIR